MSDLPNNANAFDISREEDTGARRQWAKPGLTRMAAGVAEFGGSLSGDGSSGLS